jgi:hypothetical protein
LLALSPALEHRSSVPETSKGKQKWAGLICPVCRYVFRVPTDHDGAGVVCPACNYLLQIPRSVRSLHAVSTLPGKTSEASIPNPRGSQRVIEIAPRTAQQEQADSVEVPVPAKKALRVTPSPGHSTEQEDAWAGWSTQAPMPEWEQHTGSPEPEQTNVMAWTVGIVLFGISVIGISVWLFVLSGNDHGVADEQPAEISAASPATSLQAEQGEGADNAVSISQGPTTEGESGLDGIKQASAVITRFLNAATLSELEQLVRTPDVTMPRLRAWYARQKWVPPGVRETAYKDRIMVSGPIISMDVMLGDYTVRKIAAERTPDGYKIDWESWVAWSSMRWDDIMKKRPAEPVEVRVYCKRDNYYNRLFSDDRRWYAVALTHPRSERTIYGYVDRNTPEFTHMTANLNRGDKVATTLKISYPENTDADNQVYITKFVQKGWVRMSQQSNDDTVTPASAPSQK